MNQTEVLFPNQKSNDFSIQTLEKYMLTNKHLISLCKTEPLPRAVEKKEKPPRKHDTSPEVPVPVPVPSKLNYRYEDHIIIPCQKDTLFWSFYILKHGLDTYQEMDTVPLLHEKKIKIEYVEKLRQNKKVIKGYKHVVPLATIENVLVHEACIDLATFFSLCIVENIPVLYVSKKTFYEWKLPLTEASIAVLYHFPTYYGSCWLPHDSPHVTNIRDTYFEMEHMNKPVKAFSAYKADDLVSICHKLNINALTMAGKKRPNKELYEAIVQYF